MGVIPDFDRIAWKGRRVVIAYDADAEQNPSVMAARRKLTGSLIERSATVGLLEWPISEGKGIDDRLVTLGPDRVLAEIAAIEFGGWRTRLLRNIQGTLVPAYENVALFMEHSPEWVGVLGHNEFTAGHVVLRQPPSPITAKPGDELEDHFDIEVVRWLERAGVMVTPNVVQRVVDSIARKNPFHPVRDYLQSLPPWDGVPRIGTWLIDYCGVVSSGVKPNRYAMAVGEKFLISAVARIMEPGCQADCLLVLEGDQGTFKSTATQVLAGKEWWSDQLADMGSKDASMQLRGIWIMELSELDHLSRVEVSRMKHFITSKKERFRLPYGKRLVSFSRQCVFIGTVNSNEWLKDETGGRRFWPVRCGQINVKQLAHDRDQLWAEALYKYLAGVHWWLEDAEVIKEATEEQSGRYVEDVWHQKVKELAESLRTESLCKFKGSKAGSVAVEEILQKMGIETQKQDQVASSRVAKCLKRDGWERKKVGPRRKREWRYKKRKKVKISPKNVSQEMPVSQ